MPALASQSRAAATYLDRHLCVVNAFPDGNGGFINAMSSSFNVGACNLIRSGSTLSPTLWDPFRRLYYWDVQVDPSLRMLVIP